MSKSYLIGGLVVLVAVVGLVWYVGKVNNGGGDQLAVQNPVLWPSAGESGNKPAPTPPSGISVQGSGIENLVIKPVITRTDSGFEPAMTTVKKGATVVFRNDSSQDMWPASAMHPTHTKYPETGGCIGSKFDACKGYAPGTNWEFTFNEVGVWGFHDHLYPQFTGKITVTE